MPNQVLKNMSFHKNLKVSYLSQIQYLKDFENRVGYFPILENLAGKPVLARFSYGKYAPNMSSVFFDSAKGESELTGERNTRDFLKSQGFNLNAISIRGKFQGTEAQIEEVSLETLDEKNIVVGNLIFTRDPRITLFIKPADCPVAVIYCQDENGNSLVAIDHSGADATNSGITTQGLLYLNEELGVDLTKATVSIFPSISQKNFYITNTPEKRGNGIIEINWGEYISPKKTNDPKEERFVDITSALEMQAIKAGIKPQNIQAYRVDTYEDATRGNAFSRRYSNDHGGIRPGAQILAVMLSK